ncbi:hypothetical protein OG304_37670 [Streptomyces sp. NBC_00160]|nr:hypothetical protein [Streptomyces sp. NBC_00160]MCX5309101.1 hypothetical protein [Streptomyces sp. NBC_00160]
MAQHPWWRYAVAAAALATAGLLIRWAVMGVVRDANATGTV